MKGRDQRLYEGLGQLHALLLPDTQGIDDRADRDRYASLVLNRLLFCYIAQSYGVSITPVDVFNGSIFDRHELEEKYHTDEWAYARVFRFLDQFGGSGDVHPDFIGVNFERQLPDRARMGAFYTEGDITRYISRSCMIPWLFEEATRLYPGAPGKDSHIWAAAAKSGDRYIFASLKFGVEEPLPEEVTAGLHHVTARASWNKEASAAAGLPTERWRDVVERRQQYEVVRSRIENGEIGTIRDFVTLNLDIQQFALDVVETAVDTAWVEAVYTALRHMTILDPTCGAGAFLFAAMETLEPLYRACIGRLGITDASLIRSYIIGHNLYGLDIMKEAVEITTMRLFLQLMAADPHHDRAEWLEMTRNIRVGNALGDFAEFKEVVQYRRGFDIVLGNPPYVEYAAVRDQYPVKDMEMEKCGNLYAFVVEQSNRIVHPNGYLGFIVPLSAFSTQRMRPLVDLYRRKRGDTWISHYGWRPAKLFEGVNIPLSIALSAPGAGQESGKIYVTRFNKWYREKRAHVVSLLEYTDAKGLLLHDYVFPKIGRTFRSIMEKVLAVRTNVGQYVVKTGHTLYYRNTGGLYWRIILDFEPVFTLHGKAASSSTLATLHFKSEEHVKVCTALFNSNLFWLFYVAYSGFHHVNPIDLTAFPVALDEMDEGTKRKLIELADALMMDMKKNSVLQTRMHRGGNKSQSQTFYPSLSKSIVDNIDKILAAYLGFTEEESDRIIHYDSQFRLQAQ